jgi:hypothetical protein
MKVIEPGRQQKGWSTEAVCTGKGNGGGGCGARLLVEQPDLFLTHRYVHVDHDVFVTFKCICCGVLTDLGEAYTIPVRGLPDHGDWEKVRLDRLEHGETCNCEKCRVARGGERI